MVSLKSSCLWRPVCGLLLGSGLLLLLGPTIVAQDKKDNKKSTQAQIEKKTYDFKDAGKQMEYSLFVPSKYDKDKKWPLIIALHGLGGNPNQFLRTRGLTDLAEKHGYIVAAPMGYNTKGWYGSVGLKGANMEPENLGELSEKDVMNVLDIVKKDYAVDSERIYLMGHSMGGGGTWHLGLKYPNTWAGLAPIAPATYQQPAQLEKIKDIPVILVQGDQDTLVRPDKTRRWAEQMKKLDMTYEYIEQAGGDHMNVVAENMPRIFEFFNAHKKKSKEKEPAKK